MSSLSFNPFDLMRSSPRYRTSVEGDTELVLNGPERPTTCRSAGDFAPFIVTVTVPEKGLPSTGLPSLSVTATFVDVGSKEYGPSVSGSDAPPLSEMPMPDQPARTFQRSAE